IPVRFPRRPDASQPVVFEPGVSRKIEAFLDPDQRGEMYARYDFEYFQWQLTDCPFVVAETCYLSDKSEPRAIALLWREKVSTGFWRMAIWNRAGAEKDVEILLSSVVRRVFEAKGFIVSFVVSRLDTGLIEIFRRHGFVAAPRRRPLH